MKWHTKTPSYFRYIDTLAKLRVGQAFMTPEYWEAVYIRELARQMGIIVSMKTGYFAQYDDKMLAVIRVKARRKKK